MKNVYELIAFALIVLHSFTLDASAQTSQGGFHGWEIRSTLWSDINHIDAITNVPVSYRQVPGHPDDPWRAQIFTIPNSTLNPGALVVTSADLLFVAGSATNVFSFGPTWVATGLMPRAAWWGYQDDIVPPAVSNTREVNQFGQVQRGVGTSLVYCASKARWSPLPGLTIEYDRRSRHGLSWFIGCHTAVYRLAVQRGYDRYNEFQTLDHKPFATCLMATPIIGIKSGEGAYDRPKAAGFMLFAGYGIPRFFLNSAAAGANINAPMKSAVVGVGVYVRRVK